MILKSINLFFRLLLGAVFIASAYLKLFPIETFEFNFVNIGVANWYTAPFIARLLIGVEFLLGAFLFFNVSFIRFTLKATIALLAFFTAYLCIQILMQGNEGNCGCFGTYLEMTPLQSILKNVLMIGIAYWLFFSKEQFNFLARYNVREIFFSIPLAVISLAIPFVVNPVSFNPPNQFDKSQLNYTLDLSKLYDDNNADKPAVDVRNGKHILCLLSLKCEHCKVAAFKMHIMYDRHPEIPFYFLLRGNTEKYLHGFYVFTQAEKIPHTVYNTDDFLHLAGGAVPAIFWLQEGKVIKRSGIYDLNEKEILDWIQKK